MSLKTGFTCFSFGYLLFNLHSQTLYWVGGSGNSTIHGTGVSNQVGAQRMLFPGSQNTVVFDDKSGTGAYEVNLAGITSIKSFSSTGLNNVTNFSAVKGSTLNVGGDFTFPAHKVWNGSHNCFSNTGANSYIETGPQQTKRRYLF